MLIDDNASRQIYLIFQDDIDYPLSWLCRKGFKHCFVIELTALGWLVVDPSRSDLATVILPANYNAQVMQEFIKRNSTATILHLEVKKTDKFNYPMPAIQGCVGAIQYLLGIYWPFTFTPSQLYNKLIKKTPHHIRIIKSWAARAEQKEGQKMQQEDQTKQPES